MDRNHLVVLAVLVAFLAAFSVKLVKPEWGIIAWGSFLGVGGLVWLILEPDDAR